MISRWFRDLRFRIFYAVLTKPRPDLVRLGEDCQWTILDKELDRDSRVICAGAGNDISFEKALIANYDCSVVLLDPSPTGVATVNREPAANDKLKFLPIGLSGIDGEIAFDEPADFREGSFASSTGSNKTTLKLPCKKLSTLVRELSW